MTIRDRVNDIVVLTYNLKGNADIVERITNQEKDDQDGRSLMKYLMFV